MDKYIFMKKLFIFLFVLLVTSCSIESNENKIGIVIHGGAGTILKENTTQELENSYIIKLEEAVTAGYDILKNGGSSKDAVEQAIRVICLLYTSDAADE